MNRMGYFAAMALVGLAGSVASARPGTINDGNAQFQFTTTGTSAATITNCNLRPDGGLGNPDFTTQMWWWYRINSAGQGRERALPDTDALTGESYVGNTATLRWTAVDQPGNRFNAELVCVLTDGMNPNVAQVEQRLVITNTNLTPMNISIFSYADMDAAASALNDNCDLVPGPAIRARFTEGASFCDFVGLNANSYEVNTGASSTALLRAKLNDNSFDNFNNTGTPFGPGDAAAGMQFNLIIPAGESRTVAVRMSVNVQPPACPGDADGDGMVGLSDIAMVSLNWESTTVPGLNGDVSGNGIVGIEDLALIINNWGAICE